jgi:signal transduction histidine kinase
MPHAVIAAAPGGNVMFWNRAAEPLFARSSPAASSRSLGDVLADVKLAATEIRDGTGAIVCVLYTRSAHRELSDLSHDLRTALNAIIGFSEFLIDEKPGPLNNRQKEYLNDVLASGRQLSRLIDDALDRSDSDAAEAARIAAASST